MGDLNEDPNFRFVEKTGSTNADLADELRSANPPREGDWLVALRQSAGKGRHGREWFDGKGNFMGSTVVELREDDPPPATLSFVMALAVHQSVLASVGNLAEVRLKWPNDVLLDGGKVSGILLELVGRSVVMGVGVNIAKAPTLPERKTAAIGDYVAKCTPEGFLASLATHLPRLLSQWRTQPLSDFFAAFEELSIHSLGSPIMVHDTDGSSITGTFAGLDETDGALRLRLADGAERVIRAGDIS